MHAECMCVIRDEMFNISPYSVNFRARIGRVKKKHGRVHMSIVIIIYSDAIILVAPYK